MGLLFNRKKQPARDSHDTNSGTPQERGRDLILVLSDKPGPEEKKRSNAFYRVYNADLSVTDSKSNTPLMLAVINGWGAEGIDIVSWIARFCEKTPGLLEAVNKDGLTAMDLAIRNANARDVHALAESGAVIGARTLDSAKALPDVLAVLTKAVDERQLQKTVSETFNKFAGREITTVLSYTPPCCPCGSCVKRIDAPVDLKDPLIEEMGAAAAALGLQFNLLSGNTLVAHSATPAPFKGDVDVYISGSNDGKSHVGGGQFRKPR